MANGNKSLAPDDFASAFTRRLNGHSRVAYYPYPDVGFCDVLVTFMIDELLVGQAAQANTTVTAALAGQGAVDTGATVFGDSAPSPQEDIHIWRLTNADGNQTNADVAEAVWSLRSTLAGQNLAPELIAPNHVLIPASNFHDCPFGPPEHADPPDEFPTGPGQGVRVDVIDAGYLPEGPAAALVGRPVYAKWLKQTIDRNTGDVAFEWADQAPPQPGLASLDANNDGALDALVGHANFVVGVIAQASAEADITVRSLNASFVEDDNPGIPTEASVARALWESRDARVINVGFAFATLPNIALTRAEEGMPIANGPPSWTLRVVLDSFKDQPAHFVVAPAGNQNCVIPQYPAAFSASFENVVGVGSIDADGHRSSFSNHGDWVSCCTVGRDVVSSFVEHWHGPTEEAELPGEPNEGTNPEKSFVDYALWRGTSFASPKVAAALARPGLGRPLTDVWDEIKSNGTVDPELEMGVKLPGLPPV